MGSEILLATLCGMAGELCRLSRERSSTCATPGQSEPPEPIPMESKVGINVQKALFSLGISYLLLDQGGDHSQVGLDDLGSVSQPK